MTDRDSSDLDAAPGTGKHGGATAPSPASGTPGADPSGTPTPPPPSLLELLGRQSMPTPAEGNAGTPTGADRPDAVAPPITTPGTGTSGPGAARTDGPPPGAPGAPTPAHPGGTGVGVAPNAGTATPPRVEPRAAQPKNPDAEAPASGADAGSAGAPNPAQPQPTAQPGNTSATDVFDRRSMPPAPGQTPAQPAERTAATEAFDRRGYPPRPQPADEPTTFTPRPPAAPRPSADETTTFTPRSVTQPAPPGIPNRLPHQGGSGFPPPPWGADAAQQRPPAPPPHHAGPPQQRYAEPPMVAPGAGSWSYADQIRPSELVPTRKIPPGRGWRRAVYRSTFGLINLGRSPDERRLAELESKIRSLLRGRYKIGVLGKGGAGKTTVAACVGSIFAELRQDDRVVAIDADIAFGKLGSRVDPNVAGSYWELATDQHLHTFADVRSRVGNNAAGLFVLPGEMATARRRVIDPNIYRAATARLDNHFTLSIIDCGSAMDTAVTAEVLRDLDALIVVTSPWVDGAAAAGQTMDWLAHKGFTGLLHRTVVVINDSDGHVDKKTRAHLAEQFSSRGQVVVQVPFDPHLRPGGVIDVDNELDATTRRRFIEIAAALAEHFPSTTDGPQERR